ENICRHLAEPSPYSHNIKRITMTAAEEVSKPIFFSSAIIVAAFLPLFTMTGVEGKIFGPMATTYGFALTGALVLALTFSPVMASLVLKPQHGHHETFFVRWIRLAYSRIIGGALRYPMLTVGIAVLALVATLATLPF